MNLWEKLFGKKATDSRDTFDSVEKAALLVRLAYMIHLYEELCEFGFENIYDEKMGEDISKDMKKYGCRTKKELGEKIKTLSQFVGKTINLEDFKN